MRLRDLLLGRSGHPVARVDREDGDKLVDWLMEGAAEIAKAHDVLDGTGVSRRNRETGRVFTLAARIAALLEFLPPERFHVCESCGRTFLSGNTPAEAEAEMKEAFGDLPKEERAVVCDDCYVRVMRELNN